MTNAKLGTLFILSTFAYAGCIADHDDEALGDAELPVTSDQQVVDACANKPHKQAVCHIPPGNPANAHTICISEHAVDKHVALHGDYLGACDPGQGAGGSDGGQGGSDDQGGGGSGSGSGGSGGGSGGGGSVGDCGSYPTCVSADDCDAGSHCEMGCCIPFTQ